MGKLRDDEIKWILDVDAKGVQSELQKLASNISDLKTKNTGLTASIKEQQKTLSANEKELAKLTKAGLTSSRQYTELAAQINVERENLAHYNKILAANNDAIDKHNEAYEETIKAMDINEMTMQQLRNRAKQLQMQMEHTSASLSPEAYNELSTQLGAVRNRIKVVQNSNKSLIQSFASIKGPVGTAAQYIIGLGAAMKALIANPVGLVIAAIVVVFQGLKKVINSNEESIRLLNQILAPLKVLLDAILNIAQQLVVKFLEWVQSALKGLAKLAAMLPGLKTIMGEINAKAEEGIKLEKDRQALEYRQRQSLVDNSEKELKIAKLRNEAKQKDLYSDAQRVEKLQEAIALEKSISEEKVLQAKENLRILSAEAARAKNSKEINEQLKQAEANVFNAEKEFYTSSMRLTSELSNTKLEMQREAVAAAKESLDKQLKAVEDESAAELNILKEKKLKGELTEKQYNDAVTAASMSALNKKIK